MNVSCPKCKQAHRPFCNLEAGADYKETDCRDKGQGFAFVYDIDLAKIMKKCGNFDINAVSEASVQFSSTKDQARQRQEAVNEIRQNLDKLQDLHTRLTDMLDKIENGRKGR